MIIVRRTCSPIWQARRVVDRTGSFKVKNEFPVFQKLVVEVMFLRGGIKSFPAGITYSQSLFSQDTKTFL